MIELGPPSPATKNPSSGTGSASEQETFMSPLGDSWKFREVSSVSVWNAFLESSAFEPSQVSLM